MTEEELARWCQEHLAEPVDRVLFRSGYFSAVAGVRLGGGRSVVVKVREDRPRIAACFAVQQALYAAGFPAPEPVLGPTAFGAGRVATVESYVQPAPEPTIGPSDVSAALLARLVSLAPAAAGHALRPAPAWVAWDHPGHALWPRPDDDEVDLNSEPLDWMDAMGRDVRALLRGARHDLVVGHCDWVPSNVWWSAEATARVVHDWDSLAHLPEPALAGVAAAIHQPQTTIEDSADFLLAYQRARGPWNEHDRALAWAAGLWVRLFDAKKDVLCGRAPALSEPEARGRHRLALAVRRAADLLLRPVRTEDVAALVVIETDPRTTRHSPTGPPTSEEAEQLLMSAVAAWEQGEVGYWAVEHEGVLIGTAGVRRVTLHDRPCWNLYYRLAPEAWGRGLATQAAREAVAYAAEPRGSLPVIARTRPTNSAAQRVALNAGLQRREDLDSNGFHTFVSHW